MIYTIAAAVICAVALIGWRVWPVMRGTARPDDPADVRLEKWNRYLVRLMRKALNDQLLVARAVTFTDRDGFRHTIATWSLEATLVPDVEFVALARPDDSGRPRVDAVAPAAALRELLGGNARENSMWGHVAWIYAWPAEMEYGAVVRRLPSIDKFREQHGIAAVGVGDGREDP